MGGAEVRSSLSSDACGRSRESLRDDHRDALPPVVACELSIVCRLNLNARRFTKVENKKRRRYRKSAITGSNQVEMVVYL